MAKPTDYELSDEHMRSVYAYRAPYELTDSRKAHWDEWMRAHDARVLAEAERRHANA
jgi:hypothetical protein